MRRQRVRSLVCLTSFLLGLFGAAVPEATAQVVSMPAVNELSRPNTMPNAAATDPRIGYSPYATGYYPYAGGTAAQAGTYAYNPYGVYGQTGTGTYDPRYQAQYGQRYNPAYQTGYYNNSTTGTGLSGWIPSMLGAGAGAIIGAHFGFMGIVLGGALGFFLGRAFSSFLGTQLGYGNYYNYQTANAYQTGTGGLTSYLPGIAGGVLGAVLGAHFGILGIAIGGIAGFFVANSVGKMLFPQSNYGGYYYNANNTYGIRYSGTASGTTEAKASGTSAAAPVNSDAPADDLAGLRKDWMDAMSAYKDKLTANAPAADKSAARQAFEEKQQLYFDAKAKAGGN